MRLQVRLKDIRYFIFERSNLFYQNWGEDIRHGVRYIKNPLNELEKRYLDLSKEFPKDL